MVICMNQANEILQMLEGKVESLTAKYDELSLECDGLVRVLTYVLTKNKIKHQVYTGRVDCLDYCDSDSIPLHFWIELSDKRIVDYRLRMWLAEDPDDPVVPHGIFKIRDFPHIVYKNKRKVKLDVTEQIFHILTMGA
jgi:hypothetical protein